MHLPETKAHGCALCALRTGRAHLVGLWTVYELYQRRGIHASQDDAIGLQLPGGPFVDGLHLMPAHHNDCPVQELFLQQSHMDYLRLSVANATLWHQHWRSEPDPSVSEPG